VRKHRVGRRVGAQDLDCVWRNPNVAERDAREALGQAGTGRGREAVITSPQAAVASQPFPASVSPGQPRAALTAPALPAALAATQFGVIRVCPHLETAPPLLLCYILFSSRLLINVINSCSVDSIRLFLSLLRFLFFG